MDDQNRVKASLVSSRDVEGASVYSPDGETLGTIDHLMIDKVSGKVAFAVMHFGGFLGFGDEAYPVPWSSLHYEPSEGGFVANITEGQLRAAPQRTENWQSDPEWLQRNFDYWRVPYFWA